MLKGLEVKKFSLSTLFTPFFTITILKKERTYNSPNVLTKIPFSEVRWNRLCEINRTDRQYKCTDIPLTTKNGICVTCGIQNVQTPPKSQPHNTFVPKQEQLYANFVVLITGRGF